MSDVACDGSSEESRFLRDKTDLPTQPLDVQLTKVDTIKLDAARERIIEALYERNNSGLPRTRSTDEGARLPSWEMKAEIPDNRDIRARGVVKVNIFEGDFTNEAFRLKTLGALRVDVGDTIDSRPEFRSSTTSVGNSC